MSESPRKTVRKPSESIDTTLSKFWLGLPDGTTQAFRFRGGEVTVLRQGTRMTFSSGTTVFTLENKTIAAQRTRGPKEHDVPSRDYYELSVNGVAQSMEEGAEREPTGMGKLILSLIEAYQADTDKHEAVDVLGSVTDAISREAHRRAVYAATPDKGRNH